MEIFKMIVVINGRGGVGKDTLCDFIGKRYRVMNVSSITKVKEIAKIAGWDGIKDERGRKLLSDMKKAFKEYDDLPTKYLLYDVNEFLHSDDEILFVHIREVEEIEKFVRIVEDICPVVTLLIKRENVECYWGNSSDDNVENYDYDFTYHNNLSIELVKYDFLRFFEENIIPKISYMDYPMNIRGNLQPNDVGVLPILFKGTNINGLLPKDYNLEKSILVEEYEE